MDTGSVSSMEADAAASAPDVPESAPAALRQDQIQNAVAFLSHAKVRESPEATKRAFLQKKGLTEAEIAEAFRRVPPAAPAPAVPAATTPAGAAAAAAPAAAAPSALVQYAPPHVVPTQQPQPPQGVRWTQAVLGAGVLAAAAYGVARLLYPVASHWYHTWTGQVQQQAAAAEEQQQKLQATLDAMQASNQQLAEAIGSLNDTLKQMAAAKAEEEASWRMMGDFGAAGIAGSTYGNSALGQVAGDTWGATSAADNPYSLGTSRRAAASAAADAVIASSGPAAAANRPGSASASYAGPGAGAGGAGGPAGAAAAAGEEGRREDAPYSQAFTDVIEMVRAGKTPPNVRTDINDKPPDPSRPFSAPQAKPVNKPWQRGAAAGSSAAAPADVWGRPGTPASVGAPAVGSNSSSPRSIGRGGGGNATTPGTFSVAGNHHHLGAAPGSVGSSSSSTHQQPAAAGAGLNPAAAPWRPAGRPAPFSMYEVEAAAAAAAAEAASSSAGGRQGASPPPFGPPSTDATAAGGSSDAPSYTTAGSNSYPASSVTVQQYSSTSGVAEGPSADEAVALFHQSMTAATAASRGASSSVLDKSYLSLLGHDPAKADAPWRPPPPPPPTVRGKAPASSTAAASKPEDVDVAAKGGSSNGTVVPDATAAAAHSQPAQGGMDVPLAAPAAPPPVVEAPVDNGTAAGLEHHAHAASGADPGQQEVVEA